MTLQSQDLPNEGRDLAGVRVVFGVAGALVLATVTLTFAQVILRTVFNNPQAWAEEVSRYLFAWIVFLGAATAFARDTHIRIDAVDALASPAVLRILKAFRTLVVLGGAAIMVYSGTLVAWRNRTSMFYTLPWFPQVLFYAVIPLCGALTLVFICLRLVGDRTRAAKKTSSAG